MADKDIILCRCEDITRERILECIAEGYQTIDEITRVTRAGMGPCQGRTCRLLIAQELSRAYGVPMEEVLMSTFRPPTISIITSGRHDGSTTMTPCPSSTTYTLLAMGPKMENVTSTHKSRTL